ncbi:protein kinase [Actinoplanes sp. L3-i22]|uniref:serine/threonine-protein kinase n=1 Tax=Actinoplanes sp. L3-i22 TaxID=2836373 RepID=UPI001C7621D9|nr:hypothetical protein L3i22_087880 [Actinoplanes sp. L3-i22]
MPKPGELLGGRYRLDDRIAAGGMGEVWSATDTVLGRPVAVKTLLGGHGTDPGFLRRFRHEARTMAALRHPGVVAVYDFGDTEDSAYLVMARVDGQALNRVIADRGQLSVPETMSIVAQAGRALQAAHEAGVVHRDVKPGNLIIEPDGTVVLVDFGVARSANSVTLTGAREVVGTALYIAPEQVSKRTTGPAADIYALGGVAYHCLTGHPPFLGDNPLAVALQHVTDEPPPLSRDVPRAVRDLVGIALAKQPEERFPSAAAMATAAEAAVAESAGLPATSATLTGLAASAGTLTGGQGTADSFGRTGDPRTADGLNRAETAGTAGAGTAGAGTDRDAAAQAADRDVAGHGVDRNAATQAVAAGAAGAFAGRAMVGRPRFDEALPTGPVQDGNTMADGGFAALGAAAGAGYQPGVRGADQDANNPAPSNPNIPAQSGVDGPARSGVDGPARSGVDGPARSGVDGAARSGVDGPARSGVGGAARSGVDGPARSNANGSGQSGRVTTIEGPGPGPRTSAPAGGPARVAGGVGDERRKRVLLAAAAAVLVLLGLGAVMALADPFGMFGNDPVNGTSPGPGASSSAVSTSPTPKSTNRGGGTTGKPQKTATSAPRSSAATTPTGQPAETPTTGATTTAPTTEPTTVDPTETSGGDDGGDNGGTDAGAANGGSGGGNEDTSDSGSSQN